jgi:hypothetical protein
MERPVHSGIMVRAEPLSAGPSDVRCGENPNRRSGAKIDYLRKGEVVRFISICRRDQLFDVSKSSS